jgi:hypothetical protein
MYRYTVLQFNIITGQFPDTFSVESAQFRSMIFNKSTSIQICSGSWVVRTISCMNVSYLITWQWPEFSTTSHRSSIVYDTRRFPTKKPNPIQIGRRYTAGRITSFRNLWAFQSSIPETRFAIQNPLYSHSCGYPGKYTANINYYVI